MSFDQMIRDHLDALVEPADSAEVVAAVEARHGSRRRRRGLGLTAAVVAAVVAVAGVWAAQLADHDSSRIAAGPASTTTTVSTTQPADVAFDELLMSQWGSDPVGTLRAATDDAGLTDIWDSAMANAGAREPKPTVDFDEQVVVSITIPDDACPPVLERFDRDGSASPVTLEPVFVEPTGECDGPLIPKTFIAALDWSSIGADNGRFVLRMAGGPTYGYAEQRLEISTTPRSPTPIAGLTASLEFPTTAVRSGEGLAGEVVVQNATAAPITLTGCALYDVVLRNDDYQQTIEDLGTCELAWPLPVGTSRWPVTIQASYSECTWGPGTERRPQCGANDSPPGLPPGSYTATVIHQQGAPRPPDLTIEVSPFP